MEGQQVEFKNILKELAEASLKLAKLRAASTAIKSREAVKSTAQNAVKSIETATQELGSSIKKNSKQYIEAKIKKEAVIQEYEETLENLNSIYEQHLQEVDVETENLEGQKRANLAERNDLKNEKKQYMKDRSPKVRAEIKDIDSQIEDKKKELATYVKNGNFNKVTSISEECKQLTSRRDNLVKTNKAKIDGLNFSIENKKQKYKNLDKQIIKMADLKKVLMQDLKEDLIKAGHSKETALKEVNEKSTAFSKLTQFISAKLMSGNAKIKKFDAQVLQPFEKNINEFKEKELPKIKEESKAKLISSKDKIIDKKDQFIKNAGERAKLFGEKVIDTKDKAISLKENLRQNLVDTKIDIKVSYIMKVNMAKDFGENLKTKALTNLSNMAKSVDQKAQSELEKQTVTKKTKEVSFEGR